MKERMYPGLTGSTTHSFKLFSSMLDFFLPSLCGLECLSSYAEVLIPHVKGQGEETSTETQ